MAKQYRVERKKRKNMSAIRPQDAMTPVDLISVYYFCGWTDPATTTVWTNLDSLRRPLRPINDFCLKEASLTAGLTE